MIVARTIAICGLAVLGNTPAGAVDISGNVGMVSDYRFRGISLSEGQPALQASLNLDHESGIYAGIWTSTIKDGAGTSAEIDLIAGYELQLSDQSSFDLLTTYYVYPSDGDSNYFETAATFNLSRDNLEASLGVSWVPPQSATKDESGRLRGNFYYFSQVAVSLPGTPVKLNLGGGFERGSFDESKSGGKLDWSLGVEYTLPPARVSIAFVGSDAKSQGECLVAAIFYDF